MSLLQVIVLGVVQGLTEFLPISSTAHLFLTSWLLGWDAESLDFDIMLHVGTLLAVAIYFFRGWIGIICSGLGLPFGGTRESERNPLLLWLLVIGTIPIGIFGLLFDKQAETVWRTPMVMGVMLILVAIIMWVAENSGRKVRDTASLSMVDGIAIGMAQVLAIVPGCSRSGITISAGLFRNLTREDAARFSFLLSTPAISAAALKALYDIHKHGPGLHTLMTAQFAVGVATSAITGCAVIAWFLQYLRRSGFRPFIYYRIIFGIIVLALALIRRPA